MTDQTAPFEATTVERVSAMVRDLAGRDVSELSHDALIEILDAAAGLERATGSFVSRLAGELERRSQPDLPGGGLARQQGHGTADKMMQRITGGSRAGTRRQIEAGDAFTPVAVPDALAGVVEDGSAGEASDGGDGTGGSGQLGVNGQVHVASSQPKYPAVAAASLAGELSVDAAGIIVAGLNSVRDRVDPALLAEAERRLVERARTQTASEVRRSVGLALTRLDTPAVEEGQQRLHDERYLSWKQDHTGRVTIHGVLDPVTAAPVLTVMEQIVTKGFRARRDQDPTDPDTRTVGQMRADALHDVCRHAIGCTETDRSGVRTSLVVRIDLKDLRSGMGLGRIDGIEGPVPVGELRRLAGDAEVIPQVLGSQGEVLDQGRAVRLFSRAQRVALLERDGGCAKCHAPPEHCEAHHIRWWDRGGRSDLNNGVMLCTRCHHDVHRQGWQIEVDRRRVRFIPPAAIDAARRPRPGGLAALDIGEITEPWPATDELEAAVREWEREAHEFALRVPDWERDNQVDEVDVMRDEESHARNCEVSVNG